MFFVLFFIPNKAVKIGHLTDDAGFQLQSNEASCIQLNSGSRLKLSLYVPPVNTLGLQHGGQTESLWGRNYGRLNLELIVEPSISFVKSMESIGLVVQLIYIMHPFDFAYNSMITNFKSIASFFVDSFVAVFFCL